MVSPPQAFCTYTEVVTHDELIRALIDGGREDWLRDDELGIATFKKNLNVTIREVRTEEREPFKTERWATGFPDKHAYVSIFHLWYGASFVKDYHLASVDGGRALLPYPKSEEELTITREQYAVARAVDTLGTLGEYLDRAGFHVE